MNDFIEMIGKDGKTYKIPQEQVKAFEKNGYKFADEPKPKATKKGK